MRKLILPILFLLFLAPAIADPLITVVVNPSPVYVGDFVIDITATDPMGGLQNIQLFREGILQETWPCDGTTSCTYNFVSTETAVGEYDYYAQAYSKYDELNDATSTPYPFIITVIENTAPYFNPALTDKQVKEGNLLQFTVTATDLDTLTYSASNLPAGAVFNNQVFSWTPDFTQGDDDPTTYQVTFEVTDGINPLVSETITITVIDNLVPTAIASANPTSGNAALDVQFTGSASSGDLPLTYSWNFGDGTPTVYEQNPMHTYTQRRTNPYIATLRVTDADGDSDTATVSIQVGSSSGYYSSSSSSSSSRPFSNDLSKARMSFPTKEPTDKVYKKVTEDYLDVINYLISEPFNTQKLDILVRNTADNAVIYSLEINGLANVADYDLESPVVLAPNQERTVYAYVTALKPGQYVANVNLIANGEILESEILVLNVLPKNFEFTPLGILEYLIYKIRLLF